jgi:hypothetical protein
MCCVRIAAVMITVAGCVAPVLLAECLLPIPALLSRNAL